MWGSLQNGREPILMPNKIAPWGRQESGESVAPKRKPRRANGEAEGGRGRIHSPACVPYPVTASRDKSDPTNQKKGPRNRGPSVGNGEARIRALRISQRSVVARGGNILAQNDKNLVGSWRM
jgi:hypothetical protein